MSSPTPSIEQIVSSPYVRCRPDRRTPRRRTGASRSTSSTSSARARALEDALRLVEKVSGHPTVLCTHGDIVEALLTHFKANGVKVGKLRMEKGSVWALETRNGRVTKAAYLPPPKP